MLSIRSSADLARALALPLDDKLARVLALRRDQLARAGDDLSNFVHFVVVEPDDPPDATTAALGFNPTVNQIDETQVGEPDFVPSCEWMERHEGWFELAFVFTDDGFAHVLLVPDRDDVDPGLLALCRAHA